MNVSVEAIYTERENIAREARRAQGLSWPVSANVLLVECGPDCYGCQIVVICGTVDFIPEHDWYLPHAVAELRQVACHPDGTLKVKSVDYRFVRRFRNAIRENYQHAHNLDDSGFTSLAQIKAFVSSIERAERRAIQGAS